MFAVITQQKVDNKQDVPNDPDSMKIYLHEWKHIRRTSRSKHHDIFERQMPFLNCGIMCGFCLLIYVFISLRFSGLGMHTSIVREIALKNHESLSPAKGPTCSQIPSYPGLH